MGENFITSTTNNIEGCPIKKYIDTINTNIIIGTNIFSDITASFTDFFGGKSDSYKSKLESIFNDAKKELQQKAINIGANAIIGFKVDFDEISGKDKSMFMVSASGTACVIELKQISCIADKKNKYVDIQTLDKEIKRRHIINEINTEKVLREIWVDFLINNPQIEIIDSLLHIYTSNTLRNVTSGIFEVTKILSAIPKESLYPKVYEKYIERSEIISTLIKDCHLFNAKYVLAMFDTDIHLAINLLDAKSDTYTREDLDDMLKIKSKLDNLPDTGKIETIKSGILGKQQEKFICPNGHKNNVDVEFCEDPICKLNIKGLTKKEVKNIKYFNSCIEVLQDLLT